MNYFLLLLAFLVPTGLAILALVRVGQLFVRLDWLRSYLDNSQEEQDSKITTLARARNVVFTNNKCEVCGAALDETVAKTHDGHYRCGAHKLVMTGLVE